MPLISVIIPAYNRADLLPRAVASVQMQDLSDLEIIIVDDGSADNTADVVKMLQREESRIRYVLHPKNKGEAAARNTGLAQAAGDYIAFLDSDDAWLPGKLRRQYDVLRDCDNSVGAVVTGNIVVWPDGQEMFDNAWHFHNPINVRNLLVYGCAIGLGGNVLMHKSAARAAGLFDETLPLYVDVDWLCRFLARSRMVALAEPYTIYHKAPYRGGQRIEAAVKLLQAKNAALLRQLSWTDRKRAMALFWKSVALGYRADGDRLGFIRSSWRALVNNPLVPLGNYVELFDVMMGTRIVAWVRSRRQVGKNG